MNIRLINTIISTVLQEAVLVGMWLWVLPLWGIRLPLGLLLALAALPIAISVWSYRLGTRVLGRKPLAGLAEMAGTTGKVVGALNPRGLVKIKDELWEAKAQEGTIEEGTEVTVIVQEGLTLTVRRLSKQTAEEEVQNIS
ncbi:MAG: NfeD family protein [Chloroflexota bacterium]